MARRELSRKVQDKIQDLMKFVEESYADFKDNRARYDEFMRFVFKSGLTQSDLDRLMALKKPPLEFNIIEAYISRLRGEFADLEPNINVRLADGVPPSAVNDNLLATIDVLEAHFKSIFSPQKTDAFSYSIYTDLLAGGFSVAHVYTDYLSPSSFDQGIFVERVFDPTLCGFDPLARTSHKGDGRFCFQIFPQTKQQFIESYGEEALQDMNFNQQGSAGSFKWAYKSGRDEIILIVQLYEKKFRRKKIVKLTNQVVMDKDKYERLLMIYEEGGLLEVPPAIQEERWTDDPYIVRYDFVQNRILDYVETNYSMFPLVFIDGNSVVIRESTTGSSSQVTKPYAYNVKGTQKLKNFAGETLAAELENIVMHKYVVAVESVPEDYTEGYKSPQSLSVLMYNGFADDGVTPLPPPQVVPRQEIPAVIQQTFMMCDQTIQSVLGTYDAILGINQQNISGRAIDSGSRQANAVSKPYLVGFLRGLNRMAEIIMDLIPKYYVTPRTIPVMESDGKRAYQKINQKDGESVIFDYDPRWLEVTIEAGSNSAIEKKLALEQITSLAQSSKIFDAFINEKGLEVIVKNLNIRGGDVLIEKASEFMREMEAQKQMAMMMQSQQQDPTAEIVQAEKEIKAAELQVQREKAQGEQSIQAAKVAVEKQNADTKFMEAIAKINMQERQQNLKQQELDAENARTAVEMAIDIAQRNVEQYQQIPENVQPFIEIDVEKEV